MDEIISAENFINYAVETYSDTVYRVALNITQNPHDSFDISQEVFMHTALKLSASAGEIEH